MSQYSNETGSNKAVIVIVVIAIVVVVAAAIWFFGVYQPEQEAIEKARQEQLAQQEAERRRQEKAEQDQARYDQLIVDADAAFAAESWQEAQALYSEASGLLPNETYPKDQLVLVNAKLDELAAQTARRAAGVVEQVSARTGRFYVIVSSSIDDDLAMDYATKLSKEGKGVKIIAHDTGKLVYYRVALGDYATWDQAVAALQSFSSYGSGVWVLKY